MSLHILAQDVQTRIWPQMWGKTMWPRLQKLECRYCQQERERRCRVITDSYNKGAHRSRKFSQAPYIHPFNQPKYHAQINHAIVFAKSVKKKVLWYVAQDWLQDGAGIAKADLEKRKESWLHLHDKQTAGILGIMPLIKGMPVRFTDSYNRDVGAFKHATALLVGWGISLAEQSRLEILEEPEVVLQYCPSYLRVRLTNPTKGQPDGIVDVRPCVKSWQRGALQIHRKGFQLAPDFAGTAHAYCGSTLDACKGDLLHWATNPTSDSMLRAYIIRSRVRATDDILIVQPYSPVLFQQELPRGPRLLLQRQQGWAGKKSSTR